MGVENGEGSREGHHPLTDFFFPTNSASWDYTLQALRMGVKKDRLEVRNSRSCRFLGDLPTPPLIPSLYEYQKARGPRSSSRLQTTSRSPYVRLMCNLHRRPRSRGCNLFYTGVFTQRDILEIRYNINV